MKTWTLLIALVGLGFHQTFVDAGILTQNSRSFLRSEVAAKLGAIDVDSELGTLSSVQKTSSGVGSVSVSRVGELTGEEHTIDDLTGGIAALQESIDVFRNAYGANMFDETDVDEAMAFITENTESFNSFTGDVGLEALDRLRSLGTSIHDTLFRVSSFARLVISTSSSTLTIFDQMRSAEPQDPLLANQVVLAFSLDMYLQTLDNSILAAAQAVEQLAMIPEKGEAAQEKLLEAKIIFENAHDQNSTAYQAMQTQVRVEAYWSCAAVCIVTAALACPPCFAAAIPIVEAWLIPAILKEWEELEAELQNFQESMGALYKLAHDYVLYATEKKEQILIWKESIGSSEEELNLFRDANGNIDASVALDFYEQVSEELTATVQASETLLSLFESGDESSTKATLLSLSESGEESSTKARIKARTKAFPTEVKNQLEKNVAKFKACAKDATLDICNISVEDAEELKNFSLSVF